MQRTIALSLFFLLAIAGCGEPPDKPTIAGQPFPNHRNCDNHPGLECGALQTIPQIAERVPPGWTCYDEQPTKAALFKAWRNGASLAISFEQVNTTRQVYTMRVESGNRNWDLQFSGNGVAFVELETEQNYGFYVDSYNIAASTEPPRFFDGIEVRYHLGNGQFPLFVVQPSKGDATWHFHPIGKSRAGDLVVQPGRHGWISEQVDLYLAVSQTLGHGIGFDKPGNLPVLEDPCPS